MLTVTHAARPGLAIDFHEVLRLARGAAAAGETLLQAAISAVREKVMVDGRINGEALDREQYRAHSLAWLAVYIEALKQLRANAERLIESGDASEIDQLLTLVALSEYCAQISGGIPMSQTEMARLSALDLPSGQEDAFCGDPAVRALIAHGGTPEIRLRLMALINGAQGMAVYGDSGLDETLESMRDEMRRFSDAEVVPHAHEWHLQNAYIPLDLIRKMSEIGVFGLTIPEEFGGLALGKEAMCVVSEELSRGYIGVGSLGTRSEIAAELILGAGTDKQKQRWLPGLASGEILPTAVFTEPNTGSDLAALKTRAVRDDGVYRITGQKTWITHPVRADLMTILARTDPSERGYKGLSMFIAEKPRGTDADPFPANGMSGGEIEVLGYRGMKEYEISFDGFEVPAANLLGEVEGQGFKQLMQTFEAARIQTAARAVGVAQSAMDLALRYAHDRVQFGKSLIQFPRVSDKIVLMAAEIMIARQLTCYAAREKDLGRRCDLEAGMSKLLAARVAWSAADNAVQIHGGNGFALEYQVSRVLCDARILSIFEGAAEIQAQVVARRLLDT